MNFQAKVAIGVAILLCINSLLGKQKQDSFRNNSFPFKERLARSTRGHEIKKIQGDDSAQGVVTKEEAVSHRVSSSRRSSTPYPEDEDFESMEDEYESDWDLPGGPMKPSRPRPPKKKYQTRIIFEEQFNHRNWVYVRKSNNSRPNYGIVTNNKGGEFYMIATRFPPTNNRNETFVMQFSVQFQSRAHCQLAFLRLYDCQFSTDDFGIQTPYLMQVGPHICGTTNINRLSAEFQEPGRTTITPVDKDLEPVNNTSVNFYALALQPDGAYNIFLNSNSTQNGTLKDAFPNYKGYTSICGVGLVVWHSVLDKYFKGQIIIDDILMVNDMDYAERKRNQVLGFRPYYLK